MPAWTGFGEYTSPPHLERTEFQRSKTFWDLLQLIIIPLVLLRITFYLTQVQNDITNRTNKAQHDTDLQIADKQNREAVLAAYQSSITELILNHNLSLASMNPQDQEARLSAQSLTLLTLRRLDADQGLTANPDLAGELKGFLIQFLYNAHLINQGRPIISLETADLRGINLSDSKLQGINLSRADMTGADLTGADLTQAYLSGTFLRGAMLKNAILPGAYLWNAKLDATQLGGKMQNTDLSHANLSNADLSYAETSGTDFCDADLKGIKRTAPIPTTCPQISKLGDRKPGDTYTLNLEDTLARWSFFIEKQQVYNVANIIPALSYDNAGSALQISLLGEKQYTNIQAYRSLTLANNNEQFDLSLSFYITQFKVSEVSPIQALEFTISWGSGPPFSKAILQWQQIGDGGKNEGQPPNWRVGPVPLKPHEDQRDSWVNLNRPQQLNVGQWYTLDLQGKIVGDKLHLLHFSSTNDFGTPMVVKADFDKILQPFEFSPQQDPQNPKKDVVNIGLQLDGNAHDDQYDVFIDRVNFIECPLNVSCP